MESEFYRAPGEPVDVELPDVAVRHRGKRRAEHLVEIAIEQAPVRGDGYGGAAHEPLYGGRVERLPEEVGVLLEVSAPRQKIQKTADREVGQAKKTVELDAVLAPKPSSVFVLEGLLRAGQKSAGRVMDEVEHKASAIPGVPGRVERAKGADDPFERTGPAYAVSPLGAQARQGRDDLDTGPGVQRDEAGVQRVAQDRRVGA